MMQSPSNSFLFVSFVLLSALLCAAQADEATPEQRAKDARIVKTLQRLSNVDLSTKPDAKAALLRYLTTVAGTEEYVTLVEKFGLRETNDELLKLAMEQGDTTLGVRAAG